MICYSLQMQRDVTSGVNTLFYMFFSILGYSLKPLPVSSSQKLDTFVTRQLEEKLRAARVCTPHFFKEMFFETTYMNVAFQFKGESLQQEKEVSADPASRLQSLRGRDRVTRFDREVSNSPSLKWLNTFSH